MVTGSQFESLIAAARGFSSCKLENCFKVVKSGWRLAFFHIVQWGKKLIVAWGSEKINLLHKLQYHFFLIYCHSFQTHTSFRPRCISIFLVKDTLSPEAAACKIAAPVTQGKVTLCIYVSLPAFVLVPLAVSAQCCSQKLTFRPTHHFLFIFHVSFYLIVTLQENTV